MNRKEGIIMGTVILASFVTGVFAVPESQLLNVFVTNFPSNQQVTVTNFPHNGVKILEHEETVAIYVDQFVAGTLTSTVDISQFSSVTVIYKLTIVEAISPVGESAHPTANLQIGTDPDYPITVTRPMPHLQGFAGSAVATSISHTIDAPDLRVTVTGSCFCASGTFRLQITIVFQN